MTNGIKRLYVVAGPNGSGKSLFSKELTEIDYDVFDGDKHMTELKKKFPETGSEALWSYVNESIFKEAKLKAIQAEKSYAYETNFSSSTPMESVLEFAKHGYEAHLIFMGLNTIEESIQRVAIRVRNGGHKVLEDSIRYNYEHGFKNLYKYAREFDSVTLFDNPIASSEELETPKEILHIVDGVLYILKDVYPDWAKPVIDTFK